MSIGKIKYIIKFLMKHDILYVVSQILFYAVQLSWKANWNCMKRMVLCLNAVLCLLMSVVPGYTLVQIMHQNRMPQGGGYAWGFCAKGCLLSLLCLIVKIYMGDASWVMCLLWQQLSDWADCNSDRPCFFSFSFETSANSWKLKGTLNSFLHT